VAIFNDKNAVRKKIDMVFNKVKFLFAACALVAGCSTPPSKAVNDPYEKTNREAHAFNKALDKEFLRPVAEEYTDIMPDPMEEVVSNFATNMSYPADVLNYLLQGNLGQAMFTTNAFILNTVFGLGGAYDIAGAHGVRPRDTDFGETMARWGVGEGPYVELLVFGPSTERDAVAKVVDFVIDPLGSLLNTNQKQIVRRTNTGKVLSTRMAYDATIGGVYDSADSYAQARLYYLQNRRYTLGIKPPESADPFEELYGNE
jgi:phospholipid-binding lipoprotein MlaA